MVDCVEHCMHRARLPKSSCFLDCRGGNRFHDAATFHSVYSVLSTVLFFPCSTGFPSILCIFVLFCFSLMLQTGVESGCNFFSV